MNNKHKLRSLACLILVALYFIGLAMLILGKVSAGISLWVISTAAGALALYLINRAKEKDEEETPGDNTTKSEAHDA